MQQTSLPHQLRLGGTLFAIVLFIAGGIIGGIPGFCLLGLPAIIIIALLWSGSIANRLASLFALVTTETWEHRPKTDLREIKQMIRQGNGSIAIAQLEAIMLKEPHHTEAKLLSLACYRQLGQPDKARQLCLQLLSLKEVPLLTIQAHMSQIDMTPEEIQELCAPREREEKRESLLQILKTRPDDHWTSVKLIQLLITDFRDYKQAEQLLNALSQKPGAPVPSVQQLRTLLHPNEPISTPAGAPIIKSLNH